MHLLELERLGFLGQQAQKRPWLRGITVLPLIVEFPLSPPQAIHWECRLRITIRGGAQPPLNYGTTRNTRLYPSLHYTAQGSCELPESGATAHGAARPSHNRTQALRRGHHSQGGSAQSPPNFRELSRRLPTFGPTLLIGFDGPVLHVLEHEVAHSSPMARPMSAMGG